MSCIMHRVGFSHFPQPHPDPPRKIPSEKLGEPPGVVIYQAFIMVKIRENTLTRIRLGHNAIIVPLHRAYKRAFQRAREMALLKSLGNLRDSEQHQYGNYPSLRMVLDASRCSLPPQFGILPIARLFGIETGFCNTC